MATVHPRGDQRVLKTIRSLEAARFAVTVIWLGEQDATLDLGAAREEVLPNPNRTLARVATTPRLFWRALRARGDVFYCHDFYMLPFAYIWRRFGRRRRVVFDSHEFYEDLYASKIPLRSPRLRAKVARWLVERTVAPADAFFLVADGMITDSRPEKPVYLTPNFPSRSLLGKETQGSSEREVRRMIHSGTISSSYGLEDLVMAARLAEDKGLDVEIHVVERYLNSADEQWFKDVLHKHGHPAPIRLVAPVKASEMGRLLARYGAGFSLIRHVGQNPRAVPTKLYEYALYGLHIIGSDLPAQAEFLRTQPGVLGRSYAAGDSSSLLAAIEDYLDHGVDNDVRDRASALTFNTLSWEATCEPSFRELAELWYGDR
ncbi:glycosyltransferase [Nocardioides sp. Y6]|uniref:Glycosyltransferase n=2 Tax=Nocardioides malaquae TaxID=2773426 RepID=A0ABR9RTA9_9ACTN|nr:glycosyltransferase [Nocardioides malaquae]